MTVSEIKGRDRKSYGPQMRVLKQACPTCGAKSGAGCVNPQGAGLLKRIFVAGH